MSKWELWIQGREESGSQSQHHVPKAETEQYTQDAGRRHGKPELESEKISKWFLGRDLNNEQESADKIGRRHLG